MSTIWKILPEPPADFFVQFSNFPKVAARLLYHRGVRFLPQAEEFLNPSYSKNVHDPFLFRDMEKAVARIFSAIDNQEKILVHGDYDADGVSSVVILDSLFSVLGANFEIFLPGRDDDGYGLNLKNIEKFFESQTKLIITCDCGISNTKEIERALELKMDTIVTDHHTIPEKLPPAVAIIHPKVEGETYPDQTLAGAGVAFKLLQALLKKHKEKNTLLPNGQSHEAFEKWCLDMVAIATIADMVPLRGESRTLTKYGLTVLSKTKRVGLKKLLFEAKLTFEDGAFKRQPTAETIGFYIAPRINAAGRLSHADLAFKLLRSHDPIEATDLAFLINKQNQERQQETELLTEKAIEIVEATQSKREVLCVVGKNWSSGLIGLIAGKLKERYHKPTLVIANSESLVGSGRSIDGFDLINAMQKIPEFFIKFGGHPMACGFTLKNLDIVSEFHDRLIEQFLIATKDKETRKNLIIDSEVDLEETNWKLYEYLEKFEPFGKENEKPKYLSRDVTIMNLENVGKDGRHLRMMLKHKTTKMFKAVGWGLCNGHGTNWCKKLKIGDKIDIVFEMSINEWNGAKELQRTIVDIKIK